jgi:hypothetical protein
MPRPSVVFLADTTGRVKVYRTSTAGRQPALYHRVYRRKSILAANARQPMGSPAMTKLTVLLATAAFALASAAALAQGVGKSGDAPKATPATPAQPATPATPGQPPRAQAPQEGKSSAKKSSKGDPTKTQKRAGDPKGEAKGQTK